MQRVSVSLDAADLRNLSGHLRCRQDATFARLRALAHLHLKHLDQVMCCHCTQLVVTQATVLVTFAIICRADLKNDIASAFEVVRRQPAFADVEPAISKLGATLQRAHSRFENRIKTHP